MKYSKEKNFSDWYNEVVLSADLADYSTVRGFMVIKPYGFAIWENIQKELDARIKATGHQNAYFPALIPESFLKKEAQHIEGFAPEVAWVTHGGKKKLAERLAFRPTSETIIYDMFSKWVRSWRDLPILLNQWANIIRWEKQTKLFIRTREFLWQEGHTLHATKEEADKEANKMLKVYEEFAKNILALPTVPGQKSPSETFAGALYTLSVEALMPDGKSLQSGTAHNLGDKFAEAFGIKYVDKDEVEKVPWPTSWGVASRILGATVMMHSDDKGLVLPPPVAPVEAVIIPIYSKTDRVRVIKAAKELAAKLRLRYRIHLDDRQEYSPGWKFNHWELKGAPLRIEIGPRDIAKKQVVLVRRDTGTKEVIKMKGLDSIIQTRLNLIHASLYRKAKKFLDDHTFHAKNYAEFKKILKEKRGFIYAPWCGAAACEERVKEDTTAKTANIPFKGEKVAGSCIICKSHAKVMPLWAKSY